MNRVSAYIAKLQHSDEPTKRRAATIATIAVMAVVIVVWLAYFNTLFQNASDSAATVPEVRAASSDTGFSPFSRMKHGVANVVDTVKGLFQGGKTYEVAP